MLRNYFAAAVRHLLRNRTYAALNLLGLSLGFVVAILVALFVRDEHQYDRFFPDYQRIFRVLETIEFPNRLPVQSSTTFSAVAAGLKRRFPEVQLVARLAQTRVALRHGAIQSIAAVHWADPDFFRVFSFKVLAGNVAQGLTQPDGIVLTRAMALQLFGHVAVIGEALELDNIHTMRVTGVIEDLPSNTHLNIEAVASGLAAFSRLAALDELARKPDAIKTEDVYTYVKLYPGARVEPLNAALRALADQSGKGNIQGAPPARFSVTFSLIPLSDIHLQPRSSGEMKPPGDLRTLHAMTGIAVLIVIVAASNFVSMMTARASRRAVEVAVRKAVGATRSQIVAQFLGEGVLYAILALVVSMIAVELLMPAFDAFLQRDIAFDYIRDPWLGIGLLAAALLTGLAAAVYPALLLARYRPSTVLKGVVLLPERDSARLRRLLVTFQFGTFIALVVTALTIQRQAQYALEERFNLPTAQIYLVNGGCRNEIQESVANLQGVRTAACGSDSALAFERLGTMVETGHGGKVVFRLAPIGDVSFFEAFGVAPLAGRLFAADRDDDELLRGNIASDSNPSIVVNETGARALGYPAPAAAVGHFASWRRIEVLGKEPRVWESLGSQIIGVVPDFSIGSVRDVIEPTVYYIDPSLADDLILTLDGQAIAQTMRDFKALWAQHTELGPLEGRFLSQYVNEMYADIVRESTLFSALSAVAIVIAALGLLSLAVFTAERRTREIGLRKAMGASRWDILRFLGWELTRPVLWANAFAWPLAYVLMQRWLTGFAYHVSLEPFIFVAASLLALVLAILIVSAHALRVARARPAQALRHE